MTNSIEQIYHTDPKAGAKIELIVGDRMHKGKYSFIPEFDKYDLLIGGRAIKIFSFNGNKYRLQPEEKWLAEIESIVPYPEKEARGGYMFIYINVKIVKRIIETKRFHRNFSKDGEEWIVEVKSGHKILRSLTCPAESKEVKYLKDGMIYYTKEIMVNGRLHSRERMHEETTSEYVTRMTSGAGNKINPTQLMKSIRNKLPAYPG